MLRSACLLAVVVAVGWASLADGEQADNPWQVVKLPEAAAGNTLHGVYFLDAKQGWIVGEKGLCLTTNDGGTTWQVVETGSGATLRFVRFNDENTGWICGDGDPKAPKTGGHVVLSRPVKAGTLLATTDGGKTWQTHWLPTNFDITCVETASAPVLQIGVSGGENHLDGDITRSPGGGKTWKSNRCYRSLFAVRAVEAIDRKAKKVRARDLATGREYEESYDKLVLAPGAAPLRPPIPGIDLPGVFIPRSLGDTDRIKQAVDQGVRQAVLLGGGFISLELAENFARRGIATTVVEKNEQVLMPFDREMTTPISVELAAHGVKLVLGQTAEAFESAPDGLLVRLQSGMGLPAQLIVLGIGVRPENKLATAAGLEVGPRGGIQVDDFLRTSDPDIYAVGDAIEVQDFVTGQPTQVPLAGPANRQGRIAADNAFGHGVKYRGTQGTAIIRVFDLTAAMTGASEKTLQRVKRPYRKIYIHPTQHAGYYPGAEQMTLKLLFDPQTGKVLGAQAVGGAGVDKRIDDLAVAMQAGMTVFDLEEMELAYAPQYGSAKDPINMAGFVAAGLSRGDHPQVDIEQVLAATDQDRPLLLDVRTPTEYASGHIPGAVNLPVDELRSRVKELPRDRKIAAYCQVGQRGYLATRILQQAGFQAANIGGGYRTYQLWQPQMRPSPPR